MLLKYRTYLLYNISINIETAKGFKFVLFLLEKVGKIADNFFEDVNIELTKSNVHEYNKFCQKYVEMGFDTDNINVELDEFMDSYEDTPKYKNIPVLEFMDQIEYPFDRIPPVKITETFECNIESISTQELDKVNFKFNAFSTTLTNAKFIYDYGYRFSDSQCAHCKQILLEYDDSSSEFLPETINKIVSYMINMFPNITQMTYLGNQLTLEKFFISTLHIKAIGTSNQIEFYFNKPKAVENAYDSDSDDESEYTNNTTIDKAQLEFAYFNIATKTTIIADSSEFYLEAYNDKWVQIGDYMFVLEFFEFNAKKITSKASPVLFNQIESFKENPILGDMNCESFLVFKINHKLLLSPHPEIFRYENDVSDSGYDVKLVYEGKNLEDLAKLADEMENFDRKQSISINFETEVDLTSDIAARLLQNLEGKNICDFTISPDEVVLSQDQARVFIDFLNNPNNGRIRSISVGIEDTNDVLPILKSFENNYWLEDCEVKTKKPVNKETEDYAVSLVESHIGAVIQVNSKNKLIRPMERRGIHRS